MYRITILGWKRNKMPELIELCETLSNELAKLNFTIVTGGGGYLLPCLAINKP
jgi:hypothetical protein